MELLVGSSKDNEGVPVESGFLLDHQIQVINGVLVPGFVEEGAPDVVEALHLLGCVQQGFEGGDGLVKIGLAEELFALSG